MRILPSNYQNIISYKKKKTSDNANLNKPASRFMSQGVSSAYPTPLLNSNISFKGLTLEHKVVQKVLGKQFQGLGIYTKDKNFIDFSKIGYEKLATEPLNIVNASENEIVAHRFSLALAESYSEGSDFGTSWVKRYNPENRRSPLAVSHSLNDDTMKEEVFAKNLEALYDDKRCGSLDIPITDKDGKLCLDAVIFDTETTGTSVNSDRIVQIATAKMKNGKLLTDETSVFNQLVNPEVPIPKEASAVNGITDEMVEHSPNMSQLLDKFLSKHLNKQNGIIVVYNSKFDIPLLNRTIREHNINKNLNLKEKPLYKVLDPFILMQRIHPFLGAKKKLSNQYHWLFCKPMENAHDALADVQGTADVLKYCLYYLSEHRKDKSVPLTLREVLIFQNGGHGVQNIDIPLHPSNNFNAKASFDVSYRPEPLDVTNYFKGYKLSKEVVSSLTEDIGANNIAKLQQAGVLDEMVGTVYKGMPLHAPETERVPKSKGYKSLSYVMRQNFQKVLGFVGLEPYNGKSKQEIEELITDKSKCFIKDKIKEIWIKNVNPKDIPLGNDLPDDNITRRVMRESQG